MCEKESCVRYLQRIADIRKRAAEEIGGIGLSAYGTRVSCLVAYIVHLP